jgi:hypothetical protein
LFVGPLAGNRSKMPDDDEINRLEPDDSDPLLRPGPRDEGGQGGMATREQEARLRQEDDVLDDEDQQN